MAGLHPSGTSSDLDIELSNVVVAPSAQHYPTYGSDEESDNEENEGMRGLLSSGLTKEFEQTNACTWLQVRSLILEVTLYPSFQLTAHYPAVRPHPHVDDRWSTVHWRIARQHICT